MKNKFLEVVEINQGIIHKVCRLYRDSKEDREDLFQEIVFQLWKAYPAFKGQAKISTWMYRIALNTALSLFRKRQPSVSYGDDIPEASTIEEIKTEESPGEILFAALKKLDDSDRAIISLYLEEMSYSDIAGVVGITENYVGVRLNRIKSKLKTLIEDQQ